MNKGALNLFFKARVKQFTSEKHAGPDAENLPLYPLKRYSNAIITLVRLQGAVHESPTENAVTYKKKSVACLNNIKC